MAYEGVTSGERACNKRVRRITKAKEILSLIPSLADGDHKWSQTQKMNFRNLKLSV